MKAKHLLTIVITAIVCMTISAKSSPWYPFNDGVDANCFFTVGKSMLSGVIPYRDLFEQKGPLLYMLHTLAALVSYRTFFGVYLLEILSAIIFLYYGFKTMRLYNANANILLIVTAAVLMFTTRAFMYGDSAEEWAFPFQAYAIYVGMKAVMENRRLSTATLIMIGITSGCVFWMKYSVCGIYVGWFLYLAYLAYKRKDTADIFRMIGWIVVGVAIISLPIFVYFACYGAVGDLCRVYFYDNIFHYSTHRTPFAGQIVGTYFGVRMILIHNYPVFILCFLGLIKLFTEQKGRLLAFLGLGLLCAFMLQFCPGRFIGYYSQVINPFLPILICTLYNERLVSLVKIPKVLYKLRYPILIVLCAVCTYTLCINNSYRLLKKSELPQYQFAEIINQKPNATLLNYKTLDLGVYTAAGIVPHCYYFCQTVLYGDHISEVHDEWVAQGATDFVVTSRTPLESPRYKLVKEATLDASYQPIFKTVTYYLYQKIEEEEEK